TATAPTVATRATRCENNDEVGTMNAERKHSASWMLSFRVHRSYFIVSKNLRPGGLRVAGALFAQPVRGVRHRAQADDPFVSPA
ncbi:MAG TPA: hypothetical protein VJT82_03535, partial [Pyrinomonadaceae bacterium]|nr:hypothetical protein [Pyrinomonadaceae bacterium]